VLEAVGLSGKSQTGSHYDRFKGRVMFPIRDAQGRTIAFGGRILPGRASERTAKYINSPETRLFSKSDHLYGLDLARDAMTRSRRAIVVEGYTDVIMAHQFGVREAVAVLGTALGPRHIQLLRRYADSLVLVLDGDEAGQRRTIEVLELFVASEMDVRILTLPDGLDPCDFLLHHGATAFAGAIEGAVDALEHALRAYTQGIDPLVDTHRAHLAMEQVLAIVAKAPRLSRDSRTSRTLRERQLLSRMAREFRVDEGVLRERITELRQPAPGQRRHTPPASPARPDLSPADAELLEILIRHPALVPAALEAITLEQVSSDAARRLLNCYQVLADAGENCEFHQVMTAVEEPPLKRLLVDLDEQASVKEPWAHEDAAARLRQLLDDLRYRTEERAGRERLAAIEARRVTDEEELAILNELLDRERKRHGIPAPTDG
jgi:DNA primase